MSDAHNDHGSTPAAWTCTIVMLVGLTVSGLAVWFNKPTYFWVGLGVIGVGAVAGWAMARAGLGKPRAS